MKFIVEIPDERMTKEVKKAMWERQQNGIANSNHRHEVKTFEEFKDIDLASVFIGNPFCEITKLEYAETERNNE